MFTDKLKWTAICEKCPTNVKKEKNENEEVNDTGILFSLELRFQTRELTHSDTHNIKIK